MQMFPQRQNATKVLCSLIMSQVDRFRGLRATSEPLEEGPESSFISLPYVISSAESGPLSFWNIFSIGRYRHVCHNNIEVDYSKYLNTLSSEVQ